MSVGGAMPGSSTGPGEREDTWHRAEGLAGCWCCWQSPSSWFRSWPFWDFADGAVGFEHQLQRSFLLLQLLNFSLQSRFLILQFVGLLWTIRKGVKKRAECRRASAVVVIGGVGGAGRGGWGE